MYHRIIHLSSVLNKRKCSDLAQGEMGGKESETLVERIESLSHPGAKKASQAHAGCTAFGAT